MFTTGDFCVVILWHLAILPGGSLIITKMEVKGLNGENYSVTGMGQGNYNTVGASLGIASFLGLNAGNVLGGLGRCGCGCQGGSSDDQPISRYEANMLISLGNKDSEIALLKADKYTDQKIVEATSYLMGEIKSLAGEVRANKDMQCEVNKQQAVYNGVNTATVQCIQNQVQQLFGITKLVVPNTSVCPGWGNVTITPAAATTTPAGA